MSDEGRSKARFPELAVDMSGSPTSVLASLWLALFKRRPATTAVVTAVAVLGIAVGAFVQEGRRKEAVAQEQALNLTLTKQIQNLDSTEEQLRQLLVFIEDQRGRLAQSEATIEKLTDERRQLEPLVDADRAVVDALFSLQEQKRQESVWKDRGIGFFFGVVGSLLATVIWAIARAFWKARRST